MSTSFYGAHGEEQRVVRRGSSDQLAVGGHLRWVVQVGCEIAAPFEGINTYLDASFDRFDSLLDRRIHERDDGLRQAFTDLHTFDLKRCHNRLLTTWTPDAN